ncbi:MAG: chemotaxis protein CheC [Myxococcota bacterium]|nr:chemotaxis protein CheC [Myxococcota bacterium]
MESAGSIAPHGIDRIRELVSIGAGHASRALGDLLGLPCRMRVPLVRMLPIERLDAPFAGAARLHEGQLTGIFFGVDGGVGGTLGILFEPATRKAVLEQLLGQPERDVPPETAESALREVGNILASHMVSAVAGVVGDTILPSVPRLVDESAPRVLPGLVLERDHLSSALRVETEISDDQGSVRAVLVFVPDPQVFVAP